MKNKYLTCVVTLCACAAQSRATSLQVLRDLSGADGLAPLTGLTIDSSGNLYGVTQSTIFSISTTGTNFSVLHTFDSGLGKCVAPLLLGSDSMLYGVTSSSNTSQGTIFKVSTLGTHPYTTLAAFNGTNGKAPLGALVFDGSGNVVGTCSLGGTTSTAYPSGAGTVFKEATTGGGISLVGSLNGNVTGANPYAGLAVGNDGYLYGTAAYGGANGYGTIYKVPTAGGVISKVLDFNQSNGSDPETNLVIDSVGTLFGTTNMGGGSNKGNIFTSSTSGSFSLLGTFNGTNGSYVEGALLADATGNLYGTTVTGGSNYGNVYEISRIGGTINTLYSFNGSSGAYPYSTLVADSAGNLYGTTQETGSSGGTGTIFKLLASGYIPVSTQIISAANGQSDHIVAGSTGIQLTSIYSAIIANGGKLTIDASTSTSNRRLFVIGQGGLAISQLSPGIYGGSLDLTNNDLDVVGGSLATVTSEIRQGFANGKGNNSGGITSSTAYADVKHLQTLGIIQNNQTGILFFTPSFRFDGYTPGPSDVLVKRTYFGDANLDGKVDGSDYSLIDSGFLTHASSWYNGDFNYDGAINGSDYTLIDNAFNTQGSVITAQLANSTAEIATNDVTGVPEPSLLYTLSAASTILLGRRPHSRSRRVALPTL